MDPTRDTETFAELVLRVENDRWSGTRFRLRAGKALAARRKGVLVRFRRPDRTGTTNTTGARDEGDLLWIGVDGPNDIRLSLNALARQTAPHLSELILTAPLPESERSPYARVLSDLLGGDSDLSVGAEETELAWRILAPVRQAWDQGLVPMEEYRAGTGGPPRAQGPR